MENLVMGRVYFLRNTVLWKNNIVKIGMSRAADRDGRLKSYGPGVTIFRYLEVYNVEECEKSIKAKMRESYVSKYGVEYFEGDVLEMLFTFDAAAKPYFYKDLTAETASLYKGKYKTKHQKATKRIPFRFDPMSSASLEDVRRESDAGIISLITPEKPKRQPPNNKENVCINLITPDKPRIEQVINLVTPEKKFVMREFISVTPAKLFR